MNGETKLPASFACPVCGHEYQADFDITTDEELQIITCDDCTLEFAVRPIFTLHTETYLIKPPPRRRRKTTEQQIKTALHWNETADAALDTLHSLAI